MKKKNENVGRMRTMRGDQGKLNKSNTEHQGPAKLDSSKSSQGRSDPIITIAVGKRVQQELNSTWLKQRPEPF